MKPVTALFALTLAFLLGGCSDEEGMPQQKNTAATTETRAAATPSPAPAAETATTAPGGEGTAASGSTTGTGSPSGNGPATGEPEQKQPAASGKVHVVKAVVTQFVPAVVFIQPGDTVHWTNMNGHNTHSIDGLIPQGAEPWQSKLGEDYSHTFTVPGAYIYKCDPHYSLGMVAAIVVGPVPPANLEALERSPANKGMAKRAFRILKKALAARQ